MKKSIILTTAMALAILAAPATVLTTADSADTVYPSQFIGRLEFSALTDYAINGDDYAFAEGTKLYLITTDANGDKQLNSSEGFDCSVEISNLEYDKDGNLFIGNAEGKTYKYPDLSNAVEHEFVSESEIKIGDYTYFIDNSDSLRFWKSLNTDVGSFGTGYHKLKKYTTNGETECAYVINDSKLFKINGESKQEVILDFIDFKAANTISTGNAQSAMTGEYTLKKVVVQPKTAEGSDTYCTEIDLNDLSKEYFTVGRTTKLTMVRTAIALGETGNATIIIMLDENGETKSYLTLTSALEVTEDVITSSPDIQKAYILEQTKLYSRPFMSGSTEINNLQKGETVTVTEKLNIDFADGKISYYKISLERDGKKIEGYIASNYLTSYSIKDDNKTPETIKEEDGYGTNVRVVLIILSIVALVLIAAGYITFVLTKNSERKKRNRARENQDKDFLS